MGGVCTSGTARNRVGVHHERISESSRKPRNDSSSSSYSDMGASHEMPNLHESGESSMSISQELRSSTPARAGPNKAPRSFLGKASSAGLEKAVEVLDALGSSVTNLNPGGFRTGMASRGTKITILAFEVANTITKGANLLQSLSEENVQYLKKEILLSRGVQELVSSNIKELLTIAADDKREDFSVFSREVIRFGDMCKDPQWHNLDRYISKLDMHTVTHKQLKAETEMTMQELIILAQQTSELYHEQHALDKFEQEHQRSLQELRFFKLPEKGENLTMMQRELKHQRKAVERLKKKSLWSKSLEEVVEKLVDIVTYIHQEISKAFGDDVLKSSGKELTSKPEKLGEAGLALHYANLISRIDNIALRPTSFPPYLRDGLYNGLPPALKTSLRSRLHEVSEEELTFAQIKAEIGKTLDWLAPVATDTTKAYQGFGWVGEWANTGNEFCKKTPGHLSVIRLQTLYHADRRKTDQHILELVTWLQRLVSLVQNNVPTGFQGRSPMRKELALHSEKMNNDPRTSKPQLSVEDKSLLEEVTKRGMLVPGISKSQELVIPKKQRKPVLTLSRSAGSSPYRKLKQPKVNILDVLDGLDSTFCVAKHDLKLKG